MKRLKGIIIAVILSLSSILMPFKVSAAVQSVIVPTFSGDTSSWSSHLSVTNFSDGTNNQASSTLSFTFDDDYYGYVYFDGYGPSNQHIANFATVFIAGGYGEYRYSYYQNGVINITSVTIQIVNVVKPDTTVDLTQIIQLLTAIEADTTAIDNVLDSTLIEIRSVLSQLIISNGYLETLTKIRQFNIPFESLPFNLMFLNENIEYEMFTDSFMYEYPIFKVPSGFRKRLGYIPKAGFVLIFGMDKSFNKTGIMDYVEIEGDQDAVTYDVTYINGDTGYNPLWSWYKYTFYSTGTANLYLNFVRDARIIPIYAQNLTYKGYVSTDFALQFGLSNQLLDNLNIIANGTTQSNSAASDLESNNNQMADDMDDLATIENGYNQQFNNQLQQIDFSSPLQSNSGILPAANFVITIFNGLINNNPFSVLIIVVCILLIGKKVIGK